ncbi:response regulator [Mariprofundus erugo]|uniref:response regulator n=1 Tax=Mariprofundus erugo TaxID=2528639 RepID=UPI0013872EB7|nr:response regulator [Mariprofundus erugo]
MPELTVSEFTAGLGLDQAGIIKSHYSGIVLLVDDDLIIREVASIMLMEMGFNVVQAIDGLHAIETFRKIHHEVTFVLMDLSMPNMDGLTAFMQMREIDENVKVIISSGYNEMDAARKLSGHGLGGWLKKPYTIESLEQRVHQIMRNP